MNDVYRKSGEIINEALILFDKKNYLDGCQKLVEAKQFMEKALVQNVSFSAETDYQLVLELFQKVSQKLEQKQKEFRIIPPKIDDHQKCPEFLLRPSQKAQQPFLQLQPTDQQSFKNQVVVNIPQDVLNELQQLVLQPSNFPTFDDVFGCEQTKQAFRNALINPRTRPDLFTGNRKPPSSILCFGPSGTGKTLITKAAANVAQIPILCVSASAIMDKYVGEAEKRIRYVFQYASALKCVLFLDEVDALLSNRSGTENEVSRRVKTEFLQLTDGLNQTSDFVLVAATNRPQDLDDAARRRFQERIYLPLPSDEERIDCIMNNLKFDENDIGRDDVNQIAEATKGYSFADLKTLAQNAALQGLKGKDIAKITHSPVVTFGDYQVALKEVKPSNSVQNVKLMEEWLHKK